MIRIHFLALALLLLPSFAQAYPGMIRHGYVNCTSCHLSPSGGGVLTPYGRGLAGEVLSTWSHEGEGNFLYGALDKDKKPSEKVLLGGDIRVLGSYFKNPQYTEKRLFPMQADLEGAYKMGRFTLDLELGYVDGDDLQTLRHYLMYNFSDQDALRLGKFRNNYGINTDEHEWAVKNNLGWNDETETYNLEYSRLTDNYSVYATALFGTPESVENRRGLTIGRTGYTDRGGSARASVYLAEKYEIGASAFYGKKLGADWRTVAGPFVVLGFTKNFFYMGELDFQNQTRRWGIFDVQRLTYEPVQGLQLFLQQELAQPNQPMNANNMPNSRLARYGTGVLFFPRPHFELDARWQLQQDAYDERQLHSLAWLMLHYYL
jgi:hypothetical protein